MLYRCGYRVFTARDGEEALERHGDAMADIDLVLTDLFMPRLGGRQLVSALRERGYSGPAVLMTGYAAPGLDALRSEGFAKALHKPFDPSTLAGAVRDVLDSASSAKADCPR